MDSQVCLRCIATENLKVLLSINFHFSFIMRKLNEPLINRLVIARTSEALSLFNLILKADFPIL